MYSHLRMFERSLPKTPSITKRLDSSRTWKKKGNFPYVIGSIGGKHIHIQSPKSSSTHYHKYKGCYSIVLWAAFNANYCFTLYDVGGYGNNNGTAILTNQLLHWQKVGKQ